MKNSIVKRALLEPMELRTNMERKRREGTQNIL
jgi:hypothetical protein